jgi:hypothetical protein
MSSPPESATPLSGALAGSPVGGPAERRADIDGKQAQVAALLAELEVDGLLLLDPANFSWFTSGASPRSIVDPQQLPALYVGSDIRCLLVSNLDSQRFFDEELDGLGFQVKEWTWNWGREHLLTYLCRSRRAASDLARPDCKPAGERVRALRWVIGDFEQKQYRHLGHIFCHALEATCRSVQLKQTEQEIAGHLSHRVMRHGGEVVSVEVAADDRLRHYHRTAFTSATVSRHCVITATARMHGLYASASRAVCFGAPDPQLRKDHDAATKVTASYIASSYPEAIPSAILQGGQRVCKINQYEHAWRNAPAGHITGRSAVELLLTPQTQGNLQAGWAITWRSIIGAASSCDTFLVSPQGPVIITSPGNWPKKRIRISGNHFDRPDILQR